MLQVRKGKMGVDDLVRGLGLYVPRTELAAHFCERFVLMSVRMLTIPRGKSRPVRGDLHRGQKATPQRENNSIV